jgi:hypothetical protein
MIEVVQEVEKDWYLIHLEGTRHYQLWNKWDFYEVLLNAGTISLNNPKPYINLSDDEFPIPQQGLNDMVGELKKIKEERNKKYNN